MELQTSTKRFLISPRRAFNPISWKVKLSQIGSATSPSSELLCRSFCLHRLHRKTKPRAANLLSSTRNTRWTKKCQTCAKEDERDSCFGKMRRSKRANSSTRAAGTDDDEEREKSLTRHTVWPPSLSVAMAMASSVLHLAALHQEQQNLCQCF